MSGIERIDGAIGRLPLHGVVATRALETAALAGVPGYALMARAGDAVARLAVALVPHCRRVVVFAGPGNNGGDGIEAATRLRRFGKRAEVVLVGNLSQAGDAVTALARARAAGVDIRSFEAERERGDDVCDLVIDALLGIGASRAPEGTLAVAIERIATLAASGARVLAIDLPSGLDAERGQPFGSRCVVATDTLTMLTLKPGLFTAAGRDHAGRVWLARLGVGKGNSSAPPDAWLVGRADPSCSASARRHAQHKGSFGDVAVVGGAAGMSGAGWLAARAAHAAGAGRVFVDSLGDDGALSAAALDPLHPELMFRPGWWRGAEEAIADATVVCGCGGGDAVRSALPRLLSIVPRLVVDADALNAIAIDTALAAQTTARAARGFATVLTPHPLEAARLLGSTTGEVQGDRLRAARGLAERFRAVVVVKGSGTVLAAPAEVPRINATGNAALASAGTGDVLAGWIGGRWASSPGASAIDIATRAVIEHGAPAEPEGAGAIRAGDLIEALYRRSRSA